MTDSLSVIKHSAAIHMSNTLTVCERKIYNALLYHAWPRLARGVDHTIDTSVLEAAVGFTSNNRPYLIELTEGLREKSVRYNIFGKDKTHAELWRMNSGLLAEVGFTVNNTRCRYSFPNTIIDLLKNPNLYARINLQIQSRIKGHHTLPLYEFYLDSLGGKRFEVEFDFSLSDIRDLLDLGESYPDFKVFNRDVIQRAHKEINEKTDINVDVINPIRNGRKVIGFHLRIIRPNQLHDNNIKYHQNGEFSRVEKANSSDLNEMLLRVFKSNSTVNRILKEYEDIGYIRDNIEYACQMHEKGMAKNLAAYAMKALQEDYRPKSQPGQSTSSPHKRRVARAPVPSNTAEVEKSIDDAERIKTAKIVYSGLSHDEQMALQKSFEVSKEYQALQVVRSTKINPNSPIYLGVFFAFLADKLKGETI